MIDIAPGLKSECPCCQRRVRSHLARGVDGRNVCESCRTTEHRTPEGKDRVHLYLWKRDFQNLGIKAKARIDEVEASAAAQKSELDERSRAIARQNTELREQIAANFADDISDSLKVLLQSTALTQAENEKDRAHSRENEVLSILLLDIEPHHRGKRGPVSKCRCGVLTAECPEWQAIEPLREQLQVWEKKQLQRMSEGKHFGLPYRHPEVQKSLRTYDRHTFKGLPWHIARLDREIPKRERRVA